MTTTTEAQTTPPKPDLYYLVRQPKVKTDKTPLIILLHGVGSNEQDLFSFAGQLPDNFLVVSARAPYTMAAGRYAWFQVDFSTGKPVANAAEAESSRKLLINFVEQLQHSLSFDAQQVYLCGFSQGGIMSYSVGLSRPDLVKGVGILSGRLPEEVKPHIAGKEQLQHLQIFISHGTEDNVLNIQYARSAKEYLASLNLHPVYKEYKEGHGINGENLADFLKWLGGQ